MLSEHLCDNLCFIHADMKNSGFFFSFIKFLPILWAVRFGLLLGFVAGSPLLKAAKGEDFDWVG